MAGGSRHNDVPLHVKRGSDLKSMWVGQSEENIANAFRVAADDSAVLLLDKLTVFCRIDVQRATRGKSPKSTRC